MTVLYIGGAGRSGSTLLEQILGNLDGYFSVGELRFFWEYMSQADRRLCGCGRRLEACPFWVPVAEDLKKEHGANIFGRAADLSRGLDRTSRFPVWGSSAASSLRGYRSLLTLTAALYSVIERRSGDRMMVDSSKVPSHLKLLLDNGYDVRIIQLVRDGRGVAYSWSRRQKREPRAGSGEARMPRVGSLKALVTWMVENLLVSKLAHGASQHTILRYEDFVREPRGTLTRVFEDLELSPPDFDWLLDSALELGATHSVGGNPVRFSRGPVSLRLDETWKSDLGRGRQLALGLLVAPVLFRYGYRL